MSGNVHKPVALPPRNKPPSMFQKETGGIPEPVWTIWRRDKSPVSVWNRKILN